MTGGARDTKHPCRVQAKLAPETCMVSTVSSMSLALETHASQLALPKRVVLFSNGPEKFTPGTRTRTTSASPLLRA